MVQISARTCNLTEILCMSSVTQSNSEIRPTIYSFHILASHLMSFEARPIQSELLAVLAT